MKAEELRIGNYINDFGDGAGKVLEIYEDYLLTTANPVCQLIETFNPIPLTEEILLNAGFVNSHTISENVNSYRLNEFHINYYINHIEDGFWLRHYLSGGGQKIKHLHQLQNLYHALTGEELEINL